MSICKTIHTDQTTPFTNTGKIQYTQQSLMKGLVYIYEEQVQILSRTNE